MKQRLYFIVIFLLIVAACQTVPITGRKQVSLIPAVGLNSMSLSSYNEFLKSNKVIDNTKEAKAVKRVGRRLSEAVERYFREKGMSDRLKGYKWEFNLVEDKALNAWCMPGGKVVVYTGILSVAKNEAGLAVVMGHEIAHAVADHGNERMSQGLIVQTGGVVLSEALSKSPEMTRNLFMSAFGVGSQVGILLPFSRLHESEADHLGLIFMSMAGYDPNAAIGFWERMAASKKGESTPEFLSTHPADKTRINNIKGLIPEAVKYSK